MFRSIATLGVCVTTVVNALNWSVTNEATNKTCVILDADSVDLFVKFTDIKSGMIQTYNTSIVTTLGVTGNCTDFYKGQAAQMLKVSFFPEGNDTPATSAQPWDLVMVFGTEDKKFAFQLIDYWLETAPVPGKNASSVYKFTKSITNIDLQGHENNAFKCSNTDFSLSNDSMIEMKNVRVIAFAQLDGDDFSKQQAYDQCLLDSKTSDIVPIVVGACLAALVIIVLVAYLIGRARAKRQGYASV